jgi:hypothetical protein
MLPPTDFHSAAWTALLFFPLTNVVNYSNDLNDSRNVPGPPVPSNQNQIKTRLTTGDLDVDVHIAQARPPYASPLCDLRPAPGKIIALCSTVCNALVEKVEQKERCHWEISQEITWRPAPSDRLAARVIIRGASEGGFTCLPFLEIVAIDPRK